jgi:membrane AbrB-like protein
MAVVTRQGARYGAAMLETVLAHRRMRHPGSRIALTLAIGTAGGALFALSALPLAWLLGALAATTIGSMLKLPLKLPPKLRMSMIGVVGVMLGGAFTPDRLVEAVRWLPSLAALPVYVVVVGAVIFLFIRRFSSFDLRTSFFAAAPGGLSEMIAMSDEMGADVARVSLIHATRLTFIVFTIPWIAAALGTDSTGVAAPAMATIPSFAQIVILTVAAVLGYLVARRLKLPASTFIGPLLGSAVVHLAGWVEGSPPYIVLAVAQIVIGAGVGARFAGLPLALIRRAMLLGAGATLLMLIITTAFALVLTPLTGFGLPLLLLAFIPGGFTEMSLIALAMGVDPAFVVSHHTLRVFLVVSIALPIFVWLDRRGRLGPPVRVGQNAD